MFRDIKNYSKCVLCDKKNNKRGMSESILSNIKSKKRYNAIAETKQKY